MSHVCTFYGVVSANGQKNKLTNKNADLIKFSRCKEKLSIIIIIS